MARDVLPAEGAFLRFVPADWKPDWGLGKKMLGIGLPRVEFALIAVYIFIVYSVTRQFGAAAQAAFGIGMRIVQAGFMPVVALGFSVAPVAGQNFGARKAQRVKDTFKDGALMAGLFMVFWAIVCHIAPGALVGIFSNDPAVIAVGEEYLRIVSTRSFRQVFCSLPRACSRRWATQFRRSSHRLFE